MASIWFFKGNRTFGYLFLFFLLLLIAAMYMNTGNLSAYAVTLTRPHVMEGYITNYDDVHYLCNYNFIMGDPVEKWGGGWVLRRELYFILGYPFFYFYGFYYGGIITGFLITIMAFYSFTRFLYKEFGSREAIVGMALLATYPGIMYWIGSPFAQVMIVPCCLWTYMLMYRMQQTNEWRKHVGYLSLIGILFTAYDIFIFFYPAILLIYFMKKEYKRMALSLPIVALPQLLIVGWLFARGAVSVKSENTGLYGIIIKSYFHPGNLGNWWELIKDVPKYIYLNFFDSNFWSLPVLFIIVFIWGRIKGVKLNKVEGTVLFSALVVHLFNNMAPWYIASFSMRGEWIARIYQPLFVVLLMYVVRFSSLPFKQNFVSKFIFCVMVSMVVVFNTLINFGGYFKSELTQWAWYNFYQHSPPQTMRENLDQFGVHTLTGKPVVEPVIEPPRP